MKKPKGRKRALKTKAGAASIPEPVPAVEVPTVLPEAPGTPVEPTIPAIPALPKGALEEGYHALDASMVQVKRDIKELSGDVGRIVAILVPYFGPDFAMRADDILKRRQEGPT